MAADAPGPAARLVQAHRLCVARGLADAAAVGRAIAVLASRRIPVVLLKAAALDRLVYTRPGLRPRLDTDVLVPPARFAEALRVLVADGADLVTYDGRPLTAAIYHERELRLAGGALLDLHRHVAAWPLVAGFEAALVSRATRADDGAFVPAPEDLLLGLAIHAAQDGFRAPLRLALDAALLLARGDVDPGRLTSTAVAVHAAGPAARWLDALATLGVAPLEDAPWAAARRTLAACANPWTPHLRWGEPETVAETRRGHVLGFDSPARALTFVAYRSASLALDWMIGRALSRRGSGTTLPTAR